MASSCTMVPADLVEEKAAAAAVEEDAGSYLRADQVDLMSLDFEIEERMADRFRKLNSGGVERGDEGPKAAWEIDLSKLEIGHVVEHGDHGTLFRGKYYGQDVAVKLLDWGAEGDSSEDQIAHFRTSLKEVVVVWHEFNHPNITKFIGASMGTTNLNIPKDIPDHSSRKGARTDLPDRACCVVVEYLTGGTLKQHLIKHYRKNKKLPYEEVVRLALDLARGLSFLHSKKIVHRDVKSENMLLDPQLNLKIADFGVARLVEAQDPKDLTRTTGTLGYMAPEVLDGKPYNRKCDVYSFGICLWETYCCDMPYGPYSDLSFADFSSFVVHKNLRPEIPDCCPSAMASIMRRCWDANPEVRPEMEEVVRLLESLDTSNGGGMVLEKKKRKQPGGGCFCFFVPRAA
ncbi:serine/threonine-protein kinase STY13-like [Oryza glaberrima]|nr:serine/threonine-protein kinase STY13-like [Oryza glaberrima]